MKRSQYIPTLRPFKEALRKALSERYSHYRAENTPLAEVAEEMTAQLGRPLTQGEIKYECYKLGLTWAMSNRRLAREHQAKTLTRGLLALYNLTKQKSPRSLRELYEELWQKPAPNRTRRSKS